MAASTELPTPAIETILRPSERILVSIPCRVRQPGTAFVKSEAVLVSTESKGNEEAALLIFARSIGSQPCLIYRLPVDAAFKHTLLQTPPSPSTSYFHQSSRPHITLNLDQLEDKYELRIAAQHSVVVQSLVRELRRLSDGVRHSTTPRSLQYGWLSLYPLEPVPVDEAPSTSTTALSDVSSRDTSALGLPSASSSTSMTPLATPLEAGPPVPEKDDAQHPNPYLSGFSRVRFLRKRLFDRQKIWSEPKTIKIRCATYNVNDKMPPKGTTELAPLVGDGSDDLLVFGFQEVDVRHQALLFSQGNDRAAAWEEALFRGLGDKSAEYEKLAFTQYVGVMTIVLVKKALRPAISRVETSERGIGLMGFVGNKAGVAVRLRVYDSTLTFVNCHLAAFSAALDRRRLDYSTLLDSLTFPRPADRDITIPAAEEFLPEDKSQQLQLGDSNSLFWLGDLNYRIDLEDEKLAALVKWKRWQDVLEKDQLLSDIASGKSFVSFKEASIDFPPSFKYVLGSTTLDPKRPSAYTDRVLYTSPIPEQGSEEGTQPIRPGAYTSHEILWSDHRPVSCAFEVDIRVADDEKRKATLASIQGELDKLDEEWAPAIDTDAKEVDFEEVRYRQPVTREVTLRNKGRVPAHFSFKAPQGKSICKPIYWPYPATGVIQPGSDMMLRVTTLVEEDWSRRLSTGEEDTNDVLVLQVDGGKDSFISLHSTYQASLVGLPLTRLVNLPEGIRQLSAVCRRALSDATPLLTPKEEEADPDEDKKDDKTAKPARVLWRLLESLMETHDGDLWKGRESVQDVLAVIEALDTNEPIPDTTPLTITHALIHLLSALPTPLVPVHLQRQCFEAEDRDEGYAILEGVEGVHTNILIGLMSVVRLCTPDAAADIPTIESLVPAVFGPQEGTERDEAEYERQGRLRFVRLLLEG